MSVKSGRHVIIIVDNVFVPFHVLYIYIYIFFFIKKMLQDDV